MAPPILSLALPSETGRVLSIQSHTVQVYLFSICEVAIQIGSIEYNFFNLHFCMLFFLLNSHES